MRTELTTRIEALNNQAGFVPTNIEAVGYITIAPGSGATGGGDGYLTASGSISTAKDLSVNGGAQILGSAGGFGLSVVNGIQCGGEVQGQGGLLTPASVTCNSVVFPTGVQTEPYLGPSPASGATQTYQYINNSVASTHYNITFAEEEIKTVILYGTEAVVLDLNFPATVFTLNVIRYVPGVLSTYNISLGSSVGSYYLVSPTNGLSVVNTYTDIVLGVKQRYTFSGTIFGGNYNVIEY